MEDHYGRNLSYPVSVKEGAFTDNPTTQMSESFRTAAFLALSGGLQDAYSYCARGEVFANAQTGNIVLLSQRLFRMDWSGAMHYLLPLCAMVGAGFVTICDLVGRVAFAPYELPVGILMSILGGPFFITLLLKKKGGRVND